MREKPIVTIDGPSGAGKTTVSRLLAERASLTRLDTGAMYRACALAALKSGIPWSDGERLGRLCAEMDLDFRKGDGGDLRLFLSDEDVSEAIRTPGISMGASEVSAHRPVREAMVSLQRKLGEAGGTVLEGRDTGTVVFPDAEAKFFLDAVAAVRARRRFLEWGKEARKPFEEVLREVLQRDVQDSTREHSPLRMARDAVYIDTTTLTADEVVTEMLRHIPGEPGKGK
ncbi:MAG: (d)CMP kinase [Deltaproteobacteria bacterium]|nr:(d)CMP kinase [Deltaproteobacteria bacterium]